MTNDECVYWLFHHTAREVELRNQRQMRKAVLARREARRIGRIIRDRINEGTWQNGLTQLPNDEPSSRLL